MCEMHCGSKAVKYLKFVWSLGFELFFGFFFGFFLGMHQSDVTELFLIIDFVTE